MPKAENPLLAEAWLGTLRKLYAEGGADKVVEFTTGWRHSGKEPVDISTVNVEKLLKDA